eukprot:1072705-Rhodomonas_salina.3
MSAEKKDEEMTFMDYFKQCDVFPKTVDDVKEVTSSGGTLSIIMAICVLILFCSEVRPMFLPCSRPPFS